jgi:hypothetical protein
MASVGWPEGAQKAQEALKALNTRTPAPDTKVDFYGFRPHVPRFCAGAPDNMIRHAPVADMGCGKVLTLYVSVVANAFTDARYMANYGVAIAQYVNQLETDGMRVEVIACITATSRKHGWRMTFSVGVKAADQPLDLAVLAFAIGHPAMLRRLYFAFSERSEAREDSSYGQACDTKLSDLINPPIGAVILNDMKSANSYAGTPEEALAHVAKQIEAALEAL